MEDFAGAYLARKNDIFALPRNEKHTIAIFHLGGIAIEWGAIKSTGEV